MSTDLLSCKRDNKSLKYGEIDTPRCNGATTNNIKTFFTIMDILSFKVFNSENHRHLEPNLDNTSTSR